MNEGYLKEEDLYGDESGTSRFGRRIAGLEGFFNRSAREGSRISWGLILLIAFVVYAVINFIVVILKIF